MYKKLFSEFLTHTNTLQIYKDEKLLFTSSKERLLPLIDYISNFGTSYREVVIFDKVIGRAAALLCAKIDCSEVYSPLGSELAVEVLKRYGISYHLVKIVPFICNNSQDDMCPIEKLSLDKNPEEFYQALLGLINSKAKAPNL